jgi:surfactin family lipopeptide synthetase A
LGEIETALRSHPAIRAALALVRDEGEKRIVAYVVLAQESAITTAELRDHLRQKLPDYMVPGAWVILCPRCH